jgi:hypothetical protein
MVFNATVTPEGFQNRLNHLQEDITESRKEAAYDYLRNRIEKHFETANGERYKPNTFEYERRKRELLGALPQLYASGRLMRELLTSSKVNARGELLLDFPKYGIYQINMGRDFTQPDRKELKIWRDIWYERMQKGGMLHSKANTINTII